MSVAGKRFRRSASANRRPYWRQLNLTQVLGGEGSSPGRRLTCARAVLSPVPACPGAARFSFLLRNASSARTNRARSPNGFHRVVVLRFEDVNARPPRLDLFTLPWLFASDGQGVVFEMPTTRPRRTPDSVGLGRSESSFRCLDQASNSACLSSRVRVCHPRLWGGRKAGDFCKSLILREI